MTSAQLLLTSDRLTQFEAALGVDGVSALINEAEAEVSTFTSGYRVDQAVLDGYARTLAVYKLHLAAEIGVPADLRTAYDSVWKSLKEIGSGKSGAVVTDDDGDGVSSGSGGFGSQTRLAMRGDPTA